MHRRIDAALVAELLALLALGALAFGLTAGYLDHVAWFQQMSGWCFPYATLAGRGVRLYADGGHLSVPPLSFLALHWVAPHAPTRFDEDVLCRATTLVTPIVLYLGTRRALPPRVAFLSAAGIMSCHPVGTLLYNQLCFLLAASGAVVAFPAMLPSRARERATRVRLAVAGALVAAALMTKQTSGGGAAAGIAVALALFPAGTAWRTRLSRAALFVGTTAAAFVLLGLALTPYISFGGMLRDVFVFAGEPKGTRAQLLGRALATLGSLARNAAWLPATVPGLALVLGYLAVKKRLPAPERGRARVLLPAAFVVVVTAIAAACPLVAWKGGAPVVQWLWSDAGLAFFAGQRFWYVLVPAVCLLPFVRRARRVWLPPALVGLSMFITGMLSCPTGWWSSWLDFWGRLWSPPLVFLGNAACLVLAGAVAARLAPARHARLAMLAAHLLVGLEIVCPSWLYTWQPRLVDGLYERWPDVPTLGATKVRRDLHEAHDTILTVRMLAPSPTDDVLWLPADPPVQAYVGRPAPRLSSPLVFMDQYPDRWVDADFERLLEHPPAVVVLGPEPRPPIWPQFRREPIWGTTRLIARVESELLLPDRYELVANLPWPDPSGLAECYRTYRRR